MKADQRNNLIYGNEKSYSVDYSQQTKNHESGEPVGWTVVRLMTKFFEFIMRFVTHFICFSLIKESIISQQAECLKAGKLKEEPGTKFQVPNKLKALKLKNESY